MPPRSRVCVLYGNELREYAFAPPHPFSGERLTGFWKEFQRRNLDDRVAVEKPEVCDEKDLLSFHEKAYVDFVKQASYRGTGFLDYGDTPAFKGIFEAASRVVGTTLKALRLIMEGKFEHAFCPLGGLHHARRDRAGGFCVFNDVGVTIEYLKQVYGLSRIAYVDIDAHHGDGVFYGFEADPTIFIADIHEDGRFLYPGTGFMDETGVGRAKGTKVNFPLPLGAGDDQFREAFQKVESFIDQHRPQVILFQCGADSIFGDPIAQLGLTENSHILATTSLRKLAEKHSGNRLLAMGGGGYSIQNLSKTWCRVVEELL